MPLNKKRKRKKKKKNSAFSIAWPKIHVILRSYGPMPEQTNLFSFSLPFSICYLYYFNLSSLFLKNLDGNHLAWRRVLVGKMLLLLKNEYKSNYAQLTKTYFNSWTNLKRKNTKGVKEGIYGEMLLSSVRVWEISRRNECLWETYILNKCFLVVVFEEIIWHVCVFRNVIFKWSLLGWRVWKMIHFKKISKNINFVNILSLSLSLSLRAARIRWLYPL